MSDIPVVSRRTPIAHPAEAVFRWYTRPGAFERLTPPWESARVLARTGGIEEGATVTLRVRTVGPFTTRWVARHRDVVPGRQFVDEQVEGPFAHFVHTHAAEPVSERECVLVDRIEYLPPFGAVGAAAGVFVVAPKLERMLRYRHALLPADLDAHARAGDRTLHVAITGASGMVGSQLAAFLTTGGHRVTRLVRRAPREGEVRWDPARGTIDAAALEGVDAVVHLAGENVGAGRWTPERRAAIRASRLDGTALLARTLAGLARKPAVLVSASAVGIYGSRGDEVLEDGATLGDDFLADVGRAWEGATAPARDAGIRVAMPRFGVILSPGGGALAKLLPPFRLGVGGPIGRGRMWMSWLSLDDAVGMLHHAIITPSLEGPFNAVAPTPVTNAAFTEALAATVHRPALIPVPPPALRAVFGEMAEATILASQRAHPTRLLASGYPFRHASIQRALAHLLGS